MLHTVLLLLPGARARPRTGLGGRRGHRGGRVDPAGPIRILGRPPVEPGAHSRADRRRRAPLRRFWRWVDSRSPIDPLWQLDSIAVEPDAQGQGYGSLLIRHGLARARTDGVGAFLSTGTQRNVRIYERCGFHVTENAEAPGGGPRIWFMRWDP